MDPDLSNQAAVLYWGWKQGRYAQDVPEKDVIESVKALDEWLKEEMPT